jgi:hypothetical protein
VAEQRELRVDRTEVVQANDPRRAARGATGGVVLVEHHDAQVALPREFVGAAQADDAAADDRNVRRALAHGRFRLMNRLKS